VGNAFYGGTFHASLWSGTAASWEDLSLVVPGGPGSWGETWALGIWNDDSNTYVAGWGRNIASGRDEALLWTRPIAPSCIADFNQDGGVDGVDVEAFFLVWQTGDTRADANQDGGVDGVDVETFFLAWQAGGC